MGIVVVSGANAVCPFGTAPATINATSQSTCFGGSKPVATIMDISLSGFGMCSSLANPQVASATAAALGVLTPQPCTFVPAGTWSAGKPDIIIGGKAVLTNDACIHCAMGQGRVSIVSPGQAKVIIG